jgi:hypothetical protein
MRDATVSGMRCTGQYGAISQVTYDDLADEQITAAGRVAPASPADAL